MPRWTRIILTVLAAGIGGWAGLLMVGGATAGFAWIFLFGDDTWPAWSEWAISGVALVGMIGGAVLLGLAAWRATGNKRD